MPLTAQRFSLCLVVLLIGLPSPGRTDVQPGDTITKDNLSQAETLLTPSTRWMVEQGMPIQVIPTKKVSWPKAYEDATEKFAAQVKLAADGKDILNYVAGSPFPTIDPNDPLAGFKVMWNMLLPPMDNVGATVTTILVDKNGATEGTLEDSVRWMKWRGRLYLPPQPTVDHNPPLLATALFGSSALYMRYLSPDAPDVTYVYSNEIRKVVRVLEGDRSQSPGNSDIDPDSFLGFSGKIAYWTFRILAEKDILAVVHSGKYGDPSQWCASRDGQHGILAALPCVSWEKRRVWVIEGLPTGSSDYVYSKRILYIDQDFFGLVLTELYDQDEKLWKAYLPCLFYTTKPHANYPSNPLPGAKYQYTDEWPFVSNAVMVDMQRVHATILESPSSDQPASAWRGEVYFNEPVPDNVPEVYSRNALR